MAFYEQPRRFKKSDGLSALTAFSAAPSTADRLIAEARRRVAGFDLCDAARGDATPAEMGVGSVVRTSLEAIRAGLSSGDLGPVADAFVMLEALKDVP